MNPEETLQSQKEGILNMFAHLAKRHNKVYCVVKQSKELELLEKYQSWNVSERTLNRRLKNLEDEGYIVRKQTHHTAPSGEFRPGVTITFLTKKFFDWMKRIYRVAREFFNVFRLPNMADTIPKRIVKNIKSSPPDIEVTWKDVPKRYITLFFNGRAGPS